MSASQSFLDNLQNLHTVASVALDHLQINREAFANHATMDEKLKVESAIHSIRALIDALEREFRALEEGISKPMAP